MKRNATHAEIARMAENIRDEIEVHEVVRFVHDDQGKMTGRQVGIVKFGPDGRAIIDWGGVQVIGKVEGKNLEGRDQNPRDPKSEHSNDG